MDELKAYDITCVWMARGKGRVYAHSPEEAREKAETDMHLPKEWDYLDDSFEIDDGDDAVVEVA